MNAQEGHLSNDTLQARILIDQHQQLLEEEEYNSALEKLENAQAIYLRNKQWEAYLRCQFLKMHFIEEIENRSITELIDQTIDESQKYLPEQHYLSADALLEKGTYFLSDHQLDSALVYLSKASTIFRKGNHWAKYGEAQLSVAVCFYSQYQLDSSEYHLEQLIHVFEEHQIVDNPLLTDINNLHSILYSSKGDYNQAIRIVLQDINRIKSKTPLSPYDSSSVANYYNSLGAWYTMKEDFNRAHDYLMNTAFWYGKMGVGEESLLFIYNNIARVLSFKGEHQSSISYFLKNKKLIKESQHPAEYSKMLKNCYNGISTCFRKINEPDSALYYAQLAVNLEEGFNQEIALYNLGDIQLSIKDVDGAIQTFSQANQVINDHGVDEELYVLYIYNGLGKAFSIKQDYENALQYYQKALIKNCDDFQETDWRRNPGLANVHRSDLFLTSLHQKAKAIALLSDKREHQDLALSTYQICINWIDSMRTNIVSEGSQLFWRNEVREIYGEAIEVAHRLYQIDQQAEYLEQAFTFSEKSKSILLLEERKTSEGKYKGAVPDSLIQKEKDLKIDIAFFQKTLRKEKEEKKIKRYQQFLSDSRLALSSLKEQIEKDYPEVALSKKADFSDALSTLRNNALKDGAALIEYFMTETALYAFVISNEEEIFIRLGETEMVSQKIQAFTQQLLNPESMNANAQQALADYDQAAFGLYGVLLAPLVKWIPDQHKRLYIIPDGLLNNIPFEALTQSILKESSTDFGKLNYLAKDLSISYAYSSKILEENFSNKTSLKTNQLCLATAPQYSSKQSIALRSAEKLSRSELAALEGTTREVNAIRQYFSGKFSNGGEATKADFLAQINEYGILHLATHGVADYENSGFAHFLFSSTGQSEEEDRLYHYEVANLDLQAQLAVLSACETGQGKYEEGEGVFSLARGFMQAGVPSVVMSLWKVNDLSTSELMPHFYHGLSEDLAIDQALNIAKQNYLQEAALRFRHPYYWSGFVVLGDPHPLKGGEGDLFWLLGIGGLAALLLVLLFWRSRKARLS